MPVEHHDGQAAGCQFRHHQPLISTRGLDTDRGQPVELAQPLDQSLHVRFVIAHGKAFAHRMHKDIQSGLAHIDPYGDLHLVPSLPKRARCAAPATVRDRWIDAGRPTLPSGLCCPGGLGLTRITAASLSDDADFKLQGGL